MCEVISATTMAYMALGATAASTAVSMYGQQQQGKYQEKVGKNNALSAKYAAEDAMARGAVEEQQQRNRTRALMGQQRAALAANGIDTDSGTGSLLLTDSAGMGEFDALTVRNNAMKQAYGLNVQSDNLLSDGKAARIGANNAAFSTFLTGGSQMIGQSAAMKASAFKPNAGGIGGNRYEGVNAKAAGGWGVE